MAYHIRITKKSDRMHGSLELDLSKQKLMKRIVDPYHKGKKFHCGGDIVDPQDIETIRINYTKEKSDKCLPLIRERRRQSSTAVLGINDGWYVTKEGKDVTRDIIKHPPRERFLTKISKIFNKKQIPVHREPQEKKSWQENTVVGIVVIVVATIIVTGILNKPVIEIRPIRFESGDFFCDDYQNLNVEFKVAHIKGNAVGFGQPYYVFVDQIFNDCLEDFTFFNTKPTSLCSNVVSEGDKETQTCTSQLDPLKEKVVEVHSNLNEISHRFTDKMKEVSKAEDCSIKELIKICTQFKEIENPVCSEPTEFKANYIVCKK